MSKVRSLLIYLLIPPAIIILSVLNVRVVSESYLGQELGLAQYNAIISSELSEIMAEVGQELEFVVTVRNEGTMTWISDAEKGIFLSYHIYEKAGDEYIHEGERTNLPSALRPGEETGLLLSLNAPSEPGEYRLVIDMVHEQVTWFEMAGSNPYEIELTVLDH